MAGYVRRNVPLLRGHGAEGTSYVHQFGVYSGLHSYLTGNEAIFADNPTLLYWMDELAGVVLVDAMNNENGVIEAATFGANGQEVGTHALTTQGGLMAYVTSGPQPTGLVDFSIELSFYGNIFADVYIGQDIFSSIPAGNAALGGGTQFWGDTTACYFAFFASATSYRIMGFAAALLSADWNRLAYVYTASTGTIAVYLNGEAIAATPTDLGPAPTNVAYNTVFAIGAVDTGASAVKVGSIFDYIAYWDGVALTELQCLEHTLGRPVPPENMNPPQMGMGMEMGMGVGVKLGDEPAVIDATMSDIFPGRPR